MNGFSTLMVASTLSLLTSYTSGSTWQKTWLSGMLQLKLSSSICNSIGDGFVEISGNAYAAQELLHLQFTTEIYPDPDIGTVGWWLSGESIEFPRATPNGWGSVAQLGFYGYVPSPTYFLAGAELAGSPTVAAGEQMVFLSGTTRNNSSLILKITTN